MKLSITIDCIYRCKLLGSLSTFKIVTKSYILYVHRVLHQPLSEIPVMRNLMQVSERGFSISIVKNLPQNKTIIGLGCENIYPTEAWKYHFINSWNSCFLYGWFCNVYVVFLSFDTSHWPAIWHSVSPQLIMQWLTNLSLLTTHLLVTVNITAKFHFFSIKTDKVTWKKKKLKISPKWQKQAK